MSISRQKKKIEEQKKDITKITEKFKELKSLVYDYKSEKEKEVLKLNKDHDKLKSELQSHKINYEGIVDKATTEIENFIKKYDSNSKIQ